MAKGKGGKSKGFISAGKHSNVSSATRAAMRAAVSEGDKMLNKMAAYRKGQNPWITIDNPNPNETNKRRIRVRANELYGNPKTKYGYVVPSLIVKGAE